MTNDNINITNEMLFHLVQHWVDVIKGEGLLSSQAFEEREEPSTKAWRLAKKKIIKLMENISKGVNIMQACLHTFLKLSQKYQYSR